MDSVAVVDSIDSVVLVIDGSIIMEDVFEKRAVIVGRLDPPFEVLVDTLASLVDKALLVVVIDELEELADRGRFEPPPELLDMLAALVDPARIDPPPELLESVPAVMVDVIELVTVAVTVRTLV